MANRTEYEMLWRLGAELGKDFNGTFSSAQKILVETQKEIQSLNKQQADISAYNKQQQAVQKTEEKLAYYKQQLKNVQTEMAESTSYSSKLANAELDLKTKIRETEKALAAKTAKLDNMGEGLSEAGVDIKNLSSESDRLERELKDLKRAEEDAGDEAKKLGENGATAFETMASAVIATGILTVVNKLFDEFVECTDAAIEFESAVTGIYKTVDGTTAQLEKISDDVEDLALKIPSTTEEIAAVGEAAGQLGIATDDVMEFTEVMINLGETTNLSAEEAASSLAKFTNITKTAADEYSNLGSTVVALGNSYATTEADIVSMATRLSASGTLAGLTEPEILALSAAMSSVGIEAEAGGTAMTQTFGAIEKAVANGGESLELFANISGMTADEFARAWQNNPIEALRAFISGVGSLEDRGESAVLVLEELGLSGIRQANMIQSLGLASDQLTGAVALANNAWKENNALTEEAEKRYSTTESKLTLLDNSQRGLQRTIGELFIPELRLMADVGSDILNGINEFAQEHPIIVKSLVAITGELMAFLAIYNGYIAAKKIMNTLKAAGFTLSLKSATASTSDAIAKGAQATATGAAATAQTGLNAAMAANPVGAVIALVATLTVGVVALTEAMKEQEDETEQLTAASQERYDQLQELNAEYEKTCELYGDTSYEAQSLKWELDELSASYESSKRTVAEYDAALAESTRRYEEWKNAREKNISEVERESASINALVNKLSDLTSQTQVTADEKQEILAIIKALNEEMPELSLSYNELNGTMSDTIETVKALAEAELVRRRYNEYQETLIKDMTAQAEKQQELIDLTNEQTAAENKLTEAKIALQQAESYARQRWPGATPNGPEATYRHNYLIEFENAVSDAQAKYDAAKASIEEKKAEMEVIEESIESDAKKLAELVYVESEEPVADIQIDSKKVAKALTAVKLEYLDVSQAARLYGVEESVLSSELEISKTHSENLTAALDAVADGYLEATEAAAAYDVTAEDLDTASKIYEIIDPLQILKESYAETYEAAYSSITGQYNLWDMAAKVVVTDIDAINTALETQNAYWSNYNTDLAELLKKSEYIDGLSDVIASFADGSEESVNAIAGMAQANDESLRDMVAKWQELQQQQADATGTLVELTSDYESQYNELTEELASIVDEWNLDEESAAAAKTTIDAYISALEDGTADAVATAANIASLVSQALQTQDIQNSLPRSYVPSGPLTSNRFTYQAAYADGTESAVSGVALVGEYGPELVTFGGGEKVYTADETARIFSDVKSATSYAELAYRDGIVITISPSFHIEGSASDDVENQVRSVGDELVAMVLDALEEAGIDAKRGVYA